MTQVQQPILAETSPVGVARLPLSVVPNDLEILLSQTTRPSSIVLICSAPNDPSVAIELAMKAGDWAWAVRALVRSLAVSRILAGAGSSVAQLVVEQVGLGESEPLLLAGAALAHSWLDIAESALARASSDLAKAAEPEATDVVSLGLLNMAMSQQRGEAVAGLAQARHLKDLMIRLTVSERAQAAELSPLIDYYVAGFELLRGNFETARWTLERGAGSYPQLGDRDANHAEQLARAGCTGLLSWIDAFCGDLRRATRYATSLLTDRRADSGEIGVRLPISRPLGRTWSVVRWNRPDNASTTP